MRWYCRDGISYRDLEQMMGERGVPVDHSTIYRWVQKNAPEIDKRLRWQRLRWQRLRWQRLRWQRLRWQRRRPQSANWPVNETYVKGRGK